MQATRGLRQALSMPSIRHGNIFLQQMCEHIRRDKLKKNTQIAWHELFVTM